MKVLNRGDSDYMLHAGNVAKLVATVMSGGGGASDLSIPAGLGMFRTPVRTPAQAASLTPEEIKEQERQRREQQKQQCRELCIEAVEFYIDITGATYRYSEDDERAKK